MDIRIGNAVRDAATARLSDAFAAGRLDHADFDQRLDAIWTARTQHDIDQLFEDLPAPVAAATLSSVHPARLAHRGLPPVASMLVVAALVAVAVLVDVPWVLLVAALWLVFIRPRRRHARAGRDDDGSRRDSRRTARDSRRQLAGRGCRGVLPTGRPASWT